MKTIHTLLLTIILLLNNLPVVATEIQSDEYTKTQANLLVFDIDKVMNQTLPGRLYPNNAISKGDAKSLQQIFAMYDPNNPQKFTHHEGKIECYVTYISNKIPSLINEKKINGKLFSFSVPNVLLQAGSFPKVYDMVVRYLDRYGKNHFAIVRLSNNRFVP